MNICWENQSYFKIGQKYGTLYVDTKVPFIVTSDIKSW